MFETVPSTGAKRYGDPSFVAMMFAKVLCVHLIVWLGYDGEAPLTAYKTVVSCFIFIFTIRLI